MVWVEFGPTSKVQPTTSKEYPNLGHKECITKSRVSYGLNRERREGDGQEKRKEARERNGERRVSEKV